MKEETKQHKSMPEHNNSAPKKDHSKTVWVIVAIIAIIMLIGLGIYSYFKIKDFNKQVADEKAKITEVSDKNKALENAASAAATAATNAAETAVANAVASSNFLEVKELGYKLPLSDDIKDLQYFVNDKTTFFSTRSLQSAAWGADSSNAAKYCQAGVLPLGAISKFANATEAGPTQQKALSGFVLGYAPPQSYCSDNDAVTAKQNAQKTSLIKAFNNAQKL
ncbi:hypothetical protein H0W80_04775 [Candidatus Saccharibacteria bacterium]|nr:hypothetical protein [Candidatus Saccharibacteria bacterium]